ncbi:hypothetical protein D4764_15G0008090 [Takifugu flavidus]|uniref:Uncharacterized protein n=1 Tax=Takifugu flavidus TaxID=433684 RepID=A0A5C6P280_9TELE|nr:hypothetical protein D4764_15G0008090 [Takifugu flavidus]
MLMSPGIIIRRWKEYFQELLNPTNTYPQGGTESGDQEVDHPISRAEVAKVVKQLPVADEIRPGYLKALDVVGLSWLTHLCNIAWAAPLDWQTWVVVPIFKSGDQRISRCSRGVEGVEFGGRKLFADDVVLLATSNRDLQHMLGRFATECEAAGMRIGTSKSEAMVLARKKVECLFRVGEEVLPQVEEFKYLGITRSDEEASWSAQD